MLKEKAMYKTATVFDSVFASVASMEHQVAKILHLTYNEVNILVYYLLIPFSWAAIVDYKVGYPILSILLLLLWSCIFWMTRGRFEIFCDIAFKMSQVFLLKFRYIGWNYIVSSVIICVIVPIIIYIILLSI